MKVAYSNGLTVDPRVEVCGMPLLLPPQDDPITEPTMGVFGNVEVKFFQGLVEIEKTYSNAFGYFTVILEEGTYDVQIRDGRFEDFDATITLTPGDKAPYVGYRLAFKAPGTEWDDLIITPPELRENYLFGLTLVDRFGNVFGDDRMAYFIRECQARAEMECDINIPYRKIFAGATTPPNPSDYDFLEPGYDYDFRDFFQWAYIKTRRRPLVANVTLMQVIYPVGLSVFTVPKEWLRTYPVPGQIQMVPTAGAINRIFMLPGGQFAPLVTWYIPGIIPQVMQLEYEVGIIKKDKTPNPFLPSNVVSMVKHVVGLMAAVDVMGVCGDALIAGIASQSISGDGISESYSTTASATSALYQARIESYRKDLMGRSVGDPGLYQKIQDYFAGITLVVA